jgi:hypothetical protein
MYDHVMTLSEEITFIWRRPKALSAMLFVLNRYLALLGMIYSLLMQPFLVSDEVLYFVVHVLNLWAHDLFVGVSLTKVS